MPTKWDEASKLLFTPEVIADALRAVMPDLAVLLSLDQIEVLRTEYIGLDRKKRFGDAAFRVKFKKGRFPASAAASGRRRPRRLYLLLAVEYQHGNDPTMLARVREYATRMQEDYRHQGVVREGEYPGGPCAGDPHRARQVVRPRWRRGAASAARGRWTIAGSLPAAGVYSDGRRAAQRARFAGVQPGKGGRGIDRMPDAE